MQNESRQTHQGKAFRGLSKTPSGLKRNRESMRTLFYTSSTSSTMPLINGNIAYTGLYKCAFDDNGEESEHGCSEAQVVAMPISLHNVQFHNGESEPIEEDISTSNHSYIYANRYVDNTIEYPDAQVGSWEITRAKIPNLDELQFESIFRTLQVFDWNECNFKCCPYNSTTDYDPFEYSDGEENNYYSYTHAYVRTIPRSFSVDETTGDIFISWEGFYKSCDPANPNQEKTLDWTIGVSRLKTGDSYCTTNQANVMHNNFARCTEPVAIVHQNSTRRDIVLPYGGFTVIPARENRNRRTFLLSALTSPESEGGHINFVWAFPEGEDRDRSIFSLNDGGTSLDDVFPDVWDGGTFRLHYNTKTGRPDHLCRSIFQKGIGCIPITEASNGDIIPQGDEKIVLTEESFGAFCNIESKDSRFGERSTYEAPLMAGLEIVWDESDQDGTGLPKQAIFGCYGGIENSNGNFGLVDISSGDADVPVQVMKGVYPGSILFPPKELEQSLSHSQPNDFSTTTSPSAFAQHLSMIVICILLSALYYILHSKSRSLRSNAQRHRNFPEKEPTSCTINVHGVELPTFDSPSTRHC